VADKQASPSEYDIRIERTYPVFKDNRLIQNVTRRKHQLTVMEQKVLCYILSKIKPARNMADEPQHMIQFEIRQFCRVCGLDYNNGNNYRSVKAALDRLAENSFWIDYGEGEFRFQWITTPDIQRGKGLIEVEIPKKVMPYLYELSEKFTSYQLYNILALKSAYSIMLYEFFKSYAYRQKITVSIDDLRKYLGIEETKYKEYKQFRRGVLERSIKEIEEYTDIRVELRPIRKGRFYSDIEFTIRIISGLESHESYRRVMAEINGINYIPGQLHLFE